VTALQRLVPTLPDLSQKIVVETGVGIPVQKKKVVRGSPWSCDPAIQCARCLAFWFLLQHKGIWVDPMCIAAATKLLQHGVITGRAMRRCEVAVLVPFICCQLRR